MQKQAPSVGRILIAVGFTLSCFGLILFLWIAFGGPIPLKPESYRITAYFPEATQLALESDVRIGGVSVGKVKSIELAPPDERVNGKDTTEAVIEIEPRVRADLHRRAGDPAPEDAARRDLRRAHLRDRAGPAARRPVSLGRGRQRHRRPDRGRRSRSPRAARSASAAPRTRPRSTRSSTRSTSRRAPRSSSWQQNAAIGDRRPRPRPQRRLRQPRPVPHRRLGHRRRPRPPEGGAEGPGPRHRHRLRRAQRAQDDAARRRDHGLRQHLRRARLRGPGARRDLPDPADVPARDAGDARRASTSSRRTRSR